MAKKQASQTAPYGSWKSPITSDLIVSETIRFGHVALDGSDTYWIEGRPSEGGRNVIVRRTVDGTVTDLTPPLFNARTRVHEYGGGDYTVSEGIVYFTNFDDQRLYRQVPGGEPVAMTPAVDMRYADLIVDRQRRSLICVCEDHSNTEREALNMLIGLSLDNDGHDGMHILHAGNDFYSSPRLSPDGSRLAWLTWNHPNMPWDGCELWVAQLDTQGFISSAERIAGGPGESIFQPEWSPDGVLHFISDRTGWWNLYRLRDGKVEALHPQESDLGQPQWVFGMSLYGFISPQHIVYWSHNQHGGHLADLDTASGTITPIEIPYTAVSTVCATPERVLLLAASPTVPRAILQLDLATAKIEVLRLATTVSLDLAYLSVPQSIEFPTEQGLTAYAYFYAPHNADFTAPVGELPPLLVISHGGPTSAASSSLALDIQFWTSRGFAVVDVDYGGSSGYGRVYRERLKGQWGIVDVEDCINAAKYLVSRGLADRNRMAIRGGSAGGYTTLCALTFHDFFQAGASHFGLSDLELFDETHKFESRYLYSLIGPLPEQRELYRQRSPINFVDQLSCPIIFLQGLDDKIVPPNQAELMVEVLRTKKLPVAYLAFEGEQHGFRRAENIKRALEGELYFYSKVFKFALAEPVEPLEIENL